MTLATHSDAMREWAENVGYEARYANRQWILSDYDVWMRNPHYVGPAQTHPENFEPEDYSHLPPMREAFVGPVLPPDDCPF